MMRDATADAVSGAKPQQKMAQAANEPTEALRPLASNDAPVPVPENAEDVEFDGDDGKLEFSSPSSVKSVADFYRSIMKQQGWGTQSSVINNANMVVLNFSKAGKSVSFTLMKMGPKTNVTADGAALKVAGRPNSTRDKIGRRRRGLATGDRRRPHRRGKRRPAGPQASYPGGRRQVAIPPRAHGQCAARSQDRPGVLSPRARQAQLEGRSQGRRASPRTTRSSRFPPPKVRQRSSSAARTMKPS